LSALHHFKGERALKKPKIKAPDPFKKRSVTVKEQLITAVSKYLCI
jgi:hypothetical protein